MSMRRQAGMWPADSAVHISGKGQWYQWDPSEEEKLHTMSKWHCSALDPLWSLDLTLWLSPHGSDPHSPDLCQRCSFQSAPVYFYRSNLQPAPTGTCVPYRHLEWNSSIACLEEEKGAPKPFPSSFPCPLWSFTKCSVTQWQPQRSLSWLPGPSEESLRLELLEALWDGGEGPTAGIRGMVTNESGVKRDCSNKQLDA